MLTCRFPEGSMVSTKLELRK